MQRFSALLCVGALLGGTVVGCDKTAEAKVQVEKLPDVTPTLPPVPTLPPPPFPIQYGDQSYSVFGLRRAMRRTITTDVEVTGYIAEVFQPPECEKGKKCPLPPAPHIWVADTKEETDHAKMLLVAGYAENQAAIDDARKAARKGKLELPPEDSGLLPVPVDFLKGAKIKVKGHFAYMSSSGFQSSEGVLGYNGHQTLEPSPDQEEVLGKKYQPLPLPTPAQ